MCKELNADVRSVGTRGARQCSSTHSYTCQNKAISQKLAAKGNEIAEKQTPHSLASVHCTETTALPAMRPYQIML